MSHELEKNFEIFFSWIFFFFSLKMNRQADVDAVNEAWHDGRYDMSAEEIKEFTDQVVATPGCVVADAHRAWNREHPGKEISYSVAAKYINSLRKSTACGWR